MDADIWHHTTCMRDLNAKPFKKTDGFSGERDEVFQCLLQYVQTYVIENGQLLNLSVTLNIYQTLQESYEMEVKGCIERISKVAYQIISTYRKIL